MFGAQKNLSKKNLNQIMKMEQKHIVGSTNLTNYPFGQSRLPCDRAGQDRELYYYEEYN